MTTSITIVADAGLSLADLALRAYDESCDPLAATLTATESASGRYAVGGLPSPPHGVSYALSYDAGVGTVGRQYPPYVRPPGAVLLPVRGLVAAGGVSLTLLRNQQVYAGAALSVDGTGDVGDLRVTGIPDGAGWWELVVETAVGRFLYEWPGAVDASAPSAWGALSAAVRAAVTAAWPATVTTEGGQVLTAPQRRSTHDVRTPDAGERWYELELLGGDAAEVTGPRGIQTLRTLPRVRISVYQPVGQGGDELEAYGDTAHRALMALRQQVPGLHVYAPQDPVGVPGPAGWEGIAVEAPAEWVRAEEVA